jgi:hypothetical protein
MPAPTDDKAKAALVDALQDQKTELYKVRQDKI